MSVEVESYSDTQKPKKSIPLDDIVYKILVTGAIAALVQSNPSFRKPRDFDIEADQNAIFIGKLFAISSATFFLANRLVESAEKRSIANALGFITGIVSMTFGIIMPGRWSMTFYDFNGRPCDLAHYWEAIINTTMLCTIMGEYTKCRVLGSKSTFWNAGVFIFGFLSIITREPWSTLYAWFATMCYGIQLQLFSDMHGAAMNGNTGSNMNKMALWIAKYVAFAGNHFVTFMWFLNRFEIVSYSDFVLWDAIGQWSCKFIFGFIVLMGLKDVGK